jgi:hypothetical protein
MDWSDQPAGQPASWSPPSTLAPATPEPVKPASGFGGARRLVVTTALALGLLGVGGAAVAFAADPSATPAPSTGTQTTPGTGNGGGTAPGTPGARPNGQAPNGAGHAKGDCPNMGGSGGSGGQAPSGSAAPSTDGSTSSPSTSDL